MQYMSFVVAVLLMTKNRRITHAEDRTHACELTYKRVDRLYMHAQICHLLYMLLLHTCP